MFKNTVSLSLAQLGNIFYGALLGLSEMHEKGLIHRDIKPDNIFICMKETENRKFYHSAIGDLGLAIEKTALVEGKIGGNERYLAPECWAYLRARRDQLEAEASERFKSITEKVDVYALGVCFGLFLFRISAEGSEATLTPTKEYTQMTEPEPDTIQHLVWRMTRDNPEERLSSAEAFDLLVPTFKKYMSDVKNQRLAKRPRLA